MAFIWKVKNRCCKDNEQQTLLSSVSAPLIIKQNEESIWLFTRSTQNGIIDVFRENKDGVSWIKQDVLNDIRSSDTPGGAASSDGCSMLLVYRGFWRTHFLWSLWTNDVWKGNELLLTEDSQTITGNGRGPAVIFFNSAYWIFYVNDKQQLCSIVFEKIDSNSFRPVWKGP